MDHFGPPPTGHRTDTYAVLLEAFRLERGFVAAGRGVRSDDVRRIRPVGAESAAVVVFGVEKVVDVVVQSRADPGTVQVGTRAEVW